MFSRATLLVLTASLGISCTGQAQSTPAGHSFPSSIPTLKATAQLVVVDVVVTDKNHRPVHGLTAADFKLSENNVPQPIKHFDEHTSLNISDATRFAPMPKLPPGTFTNYIPAPASGAVSILLLDALNTPLADQAYLHEQLLAYLKSAPPGMRMAIFGLSTHLVMLQGFTSDPSLLRSVLEMPRDKASSLLDDTVGGAGIQNNMADNLEDEGLTPTFVIANLRKFNAIHETFESQLRARYTLDAMNEIARYVANIPGRKNLIWFSGSFPLEILPDANDVSPNSLSPMATSDYEQHYIGSLASPFAAIVGSEEEYRETIAKLAHSQVAVYPIDARGVTLPPLYDASTTRNYLGDIGQKRLNQDAMKFETEDAAGRTTMEVLAAETGGEAFLNTNGLTAALLKAVQEGSNFYTLSYSPTNQQQDGRLRKIKVQVARPAATLSYRTGYYADVLQKPGAKQNTASVPAGAAQNSLRIAMTRGAPTPTEILIKVAVSRLTTGNQTENQVGTGNFPSAATRGPYQRYGVDYAINPGDLAFLHGEDGKVHIDYDVLVYVYDANGDLLNWVGRTHPIAGTAEKIHQATMHGLKAHAEVSVPAGGAYFLRIAVHDRNSDHFGAVEIATSQVTDADTNQAQASPAKTTQ